MNATVRMIRAVHEELEDRLCNSCGYQADCAVKNGDRCPNQQWIKEQFHKMEAVLDD